ncbi:hypothetical protein ABTH81_22120, partial [Acinetobacter baumannii]
NELSMHPYKESANDINIELQQRAKNLQTNNKSDIEKATANGISNDMKQDDGVKATQSNSSSSSTTKQLKQ